MLKSTIIDQLSEKLTYLSINDIKQSISTIIESMCHALAENDDIAIRGFGSFSLHYRTERRVRNPKTGKQVLTSAKKYPHFKPGKELRERVDANQH
jgi:integration host factor subunit beta